MLLSSHLQSRRRGVQVHILDCMSLPVALSRELAEEFGRTLALTLDLDGLLSPVTEFPDRLVQADAEVVRRDPENASNGCRNAGGVGMNVVQLSELA